MINFQNPTASEFVHIHQEELHHNLEYALLDIPMEYYSVEFSSTFPSTCLIIPINKRWEEKIEWALKESDFLISYNNQDMMFVETDFSYPL
jgi:hypothetical protein